MTGALRQTGQGDRRQPDNGEESLDLNLPDRPEGAGREEACLAVARNLWEDGYWWNDIACWHKKEWICEDSPDLMKKVGL